MKLRTDIHDPKRMNRSSALVLCGRSKFRPPYPEHLGQAEGSRRAPGGTPSRCLLMSGLCRNGCWFCIIKHHCHWPVPEKGWLHSYMVGTWPWVCFPLYGSVCWQSSPKSPGVCTYICSIGRCLHILWHGVRVTADMWKPESTVKTRRHAASF